MSRRKTASDSPSVPSLSGVERSLLLEEAAEAYFDLMVGMPPDEPDALRQYRILRSFFFRGALPDPTLTREERVAADVRADDLWDGLAAYVATDPDQWVFPQVHLGQSQVTNLAAVLRRAAARIHAGRHAMLVDRSEAYLALPTEAFFDLDPLSSDVVTAEVLGAEEVQVPFAFLFQVQDDMVLFPDVATAAVRRVLLGELGVRLREALSRTPELREVLAQGDDAVALLVPEVVPPRTEPAAYAHRVISPERVRKAVYGRFRQTKFKADWYDGRCYVTVPRLGPNGESRRFICFEVPGSGIDGTGLSLQQV